MAETRMGYNPDNEADKKKLDSHPTVMDYIFFKHHEGTPGPFLFSQPKEMAIIFDYTALRGGGSSIYYSLIYQLPKWEYVVKKVTESIEVTPTWAEYYNITIEQKHKLEGAIKQGLASAAQAVADFELLNHDFRTYREILNYFVEATKSGDEHILRSLFVDRVDAFTGENYSMITMARRWPTIITDFIRMKEQWTKVDVIAKELDVSTAEATILKTKNELFKEWKRSFLPVVKERYARIKTMMDARKASVYEYREWLKPYLTKFRAMKESSGENTSTFVTNAYTTPGFGQSQATTGVRLWCWRPFPKSEKGRPSDLREGSQDGFIIHPYDKIVKSYLPAMGEKYGIDYFRDYFKDPEAKKKADDIILKEIIPKALSPSNPHSARDKLETNSMLKKDTLYYNLWDFNIILSLVKTPPPAGFETDNLMIWPAAIFVISQNICLLYIIELWCREHEVTKYIDTIIGAKSIEDEEMKKVEAMFVEKKEKKVRAAGFRRKMSWLRTKLGNGVQMINEFFFRQGAYELTIFERVSKMYSRASGPQYVQVMNFLKGKMGIK